jgi:F0F1-type ATP synthase assembly protein I
MADNADKAQSKKTKKSKGTLSQIKQIYTFTAKEDKVLPAFLALAFLAPVLVAVILGVIIKAGWFTWIMVVLTGIMCGLLLATITLTRRSDKVGYRRMEGRPGATGAVLNNITKGGFSFPQEPVWIDMKTKDAVWRAPVVQVCISSVKAISPESARPWIGRRPRSTASLAVPAIPIHKISVGKGEQQVPLANLQKTVIRKKIKLTKLELEQLNDRLRTLQQQSGIGVPKGVDPTKVRVNRRAMRGR